MPTCASCGHEVAGDFVFCPYCGAALAGAGREQRKTVTVLFCDVTGSTALGEALDPEALRALLARYFERMRAIVERHGGTVEKFIGDAVMAVFGVPVVHEDDALRAVRAAAEMRAALPELGVQARIGINTGEVVTGTAERLATGDPVNVAARLEQAAGPGEVLLGPDTLLLVRDAVEVGEERLLELKGKAEPVPAHPLLVVHEPSERHDESPFVGRARELAALEETWERVRAERRCELVTLTGDPGVGKSRLVAEFLAPLDAHVVRGRCLSYGDGITYWPVVSVLRQLDALPEDPEAARALRALLGEDGAVTSAEEIAWAFRKLLEEQARERPLVCVFDDVQWGEETFLDLVEHVTLLSTGAPILLLCTARPELVERRPHWPGARRVEPLAQRAVEELIPPGIGGELREKVKRAAGGNPLFVCEMLAMVADAHDGIAVPPTLQALLDARLDRLEPDERSVIDRAAVEGELFHRGALQALGPEDEQVTPRLAALVRKELIRPDRPLVAGEDAFRFRHVLLRDAAYAGLPKAARAHFHAQLAAWLGERAPHLVQLDEIVGHHLEQAALYERELGRDDATLAGLAAGRLAAAGRRALWRGDLPAASNLLGRAASLLPESDPDRLELLSPLATALAETGALTAAEETLDALERLAHAAGDRRLEAHARVDRAFLRVFRPRGEEHHEIRHEARRASAVFEETGDEYGLAKASRLLGCADVILCQMGAAGAALEAALAHARRAGERGILRSVVAQIATAAVFGPMPVDEAHARCTALLDEAPEDPLLTARVTMASGYLAALAGRFDAADDLCGRSVRMLEEVGAGLGLAAMRLWTGGAKLLADDPVAAEAELRAGVEHLEAIGERGVLAALTPRLAEALLAQGKDDEAERYAAAAEEATTPSDVMAGVAWRSVRAVLAARRGETAEAAALAHAAVALAAPTDSPTLRGEALLALAAATGDPAPALEARLLFEAKGTPVGVRRAQELAALTARDAAPS